MERFQPTFCLRPTPNLILINPMRPGHCHGLIQRLTVPPEVERGETIHNALRGIQHFDHTVRHLSLRPLLDHLAANRQRPGRELQREWTLGVHEVPSTRALKAKRSQSFGKLSHGCGRYEIEIALHVQAARIDLDRAAARQYGRDTRPGKCSRNQGGQFLNHCRVADARHRALPLRRGRRRPRKYFCCSVRGRASNAD